MELSFRLPQWLMLFLAEQYIMVLVASFGMIFLIFIFRTLVLILEKYLFPKIWLGVAEAYSQLIVMSLFCIFVLGAPSMLILVICDVSAIKLLIIWLTLFFLMFLFTLIKRKAIMKWLAEQEA